MSEVWQAKRWTEFKPTELTPMWAHGLKHFYIGEVCELESGHIVVPLNWIVREGVVWADCLDVSGPKVSFYVFSIIHLLY